MPFANLNAAGTQTQVDIKEDVRGSKTTTTVAVTSTSVIALPANANRSTYSLYNSGAASVYLKEGIVGSLTTHEAIIPSGFYWQPDASEARYLGAVSLMTASGTASVQVSEATLTI